MRTFALGDVHGQIFQLEDVLVKSGFNFNEDKLIFLGDVVDRGEQPFECIDLLISIKNLLPIAGNHDLNFLNWTTIGDDVFGGNHGSQITQFIWNIMDEADRQYYLQNYFYRMRAFAVVNNRLFVHGGIDTKKPVPEQDIHNLAWNRSMWEKAVTTSKKVTTLEQYREIYIGHTPTTYYDVTVPMNCNGIWNIDTGCGKEGLLTIMDVETNEFWQA